MSKKNNDWNGFHGLDNSISEAIIEESADDEIEHCIDNYQKKEEVRNHNVGNSDYCKHEIQPWDIWNEYKLNPFDADIVKRILRRKKEPGITMKQSRRMDYEKIMHICEERIRQIDSGEDVWIEEEGETK